MSRKAIEIIDLGKEYRIGESIKYNTLRDSLVRAVTNTYHGFTSRIRTSPNNEKLGNNAVNDYGILEQQPVMKSHRIDPNYIWSLRNVSFDVEQGEIIGIIGRNGAGKSTLLKIVSGITEPTEGRINIYGRIGSLLEVGTGFHPELTGRENIFLNGAILGMKRREIERKLDEIVEFSGVEKFIDTPVKFYSSGMRVRLGFSVAAHLEPDILLLDEVLAVGDAAFQKKCLGRLDNVATSDGRTVLFVSHDLAAIQSLCHRTILLENGKVKAEGSTTEIIDMYLGSMTSIDEIRLENRTDIDYSSDRSVIATFLKIENADNSKPIKPSSRIIFKIGYRSEDPVRNLQVQIKIRDFQTNQLITTLDSENSSGIPELIGNEGTIACITDNTFITSGKCRIDLQFYVGSQRAYKLENAGIFSVEEENVNGSSNTSRYYGSFLLKHKFLIEN